MSTPWSGGRYEAVGQRIASIAGQVVDAVGRRRALDGAAVVDLACGTGSAALAAADRGATVTAVDLTAELLEQARAKAADRAITWVTADAADTGLPSDAFDAAVSNMGIIFVDPARQVAELARLLKPGAALGFSSWVRSARNPFHDPIVEVLGAPPAADFTPDQWGDPEVVHDRLAADFGHVEIVDGRHPWEFASLDAALGFLTDESPMHVALFARVDAAARDRLLAAFTAALRPHASADGVRFTAPYAVITAVRRD